MTVWNEPFLRAAFGLFFVGWLSYSALLLAILVKEAEVESNWERLDIAFNWFGFALLVGPVLLFCDLRKVIHR